MASRKEAVEAAIRKLGPGWTQDAVAELSGVSGASVHRLAKGLRDIPPPKKRNGTAKIVDIEGLTAEDQFPEGSEVLEKLKAVQGKVQEKVSRRYSQVIEINDSKPVAIALFSDLHLGGPYVDYRAIEADAQLVRDTEGFYGVAAGDYFDNWIGKLEWIQRGQAVPFAEEVSLVEWWFDTLREKLLCVVAGNHDFRTKKTAGIDVIARILRDVKCLFDGDEVRFLLKHGKSQKRFKVRHMWRYKSVFNQSHGIERDIERGEGDFDVGVAAHEHRGTLFREFTNHGDKALAVILGTYKYHDRYAVQWGFRKSPHDASGALISWPDGRLHHMPDLQSAADYLKFLRKP